MLAYAFDKSPADTVLIIITADPTHAYGLSILRMRSYRIALLTPERTASSALMSQVTVTYNWTYNEVGEDTAHPPPSPRIRSKGKEKARSKDEQCERTAADYGVAWTQRAPNTGPSCSHNKAPESDGTKTYSPPDLTEVNIADYLPEAPLAQEYKKLEEQASPDPTGPEALEELNTWEEDGVILSVPDTDNEDEDVAVAIALSEAEREAELLGQEEKDLNLALAQSMLDITALGDVGGGALDGPVATTSKVTLEPGPDSIHRPELGNSPSHAALAQDSPPEEPPAYTARHYEPLSPRFMQPSEKLAPSHPQSGSGSPVSSTSSSGSSPTQPSFRPTFIQESELVDDSRSASSPIASPLTEPSPPQIISEGSTHPFAPNEPDASGQASPLSSTPESTPPIVHPSDTEVPTHYQVLLDVMREYREKGVISVRRAFLGEQLPKRHPNVYAQAGVEAAGKRLKSYVDNAIAIGILMRESEENVSLALAHIQPARVPNPSGEPGLSKTTPIAEGTHRAPSKRKGVPSHFGVLLDVMEELRDGGRVTSVSRGYLGYILPERQPDVYILAGVASASKPSRKYIDTAIGLGIVLRESDEYVALPTPQIPAHFITLVLFMREQHVAGAETVRRMTLGAELPKRDVNIYAHAGLGAASKPLKKYVDAAIDSGILVRVTEEHVALERLYR
jgi:hypothetical protein